jgi:hypothetical protein
MPSSASCRDAHAVMPRPRGIQDRTASDAVVLGGLELWRATHNWDFGDMSRPTVGVIAGVIFALPIYIGLFLIAYNGVCSLFPALTTVHLPWWTS